MSLHDDADASPRLELGELLRKARVATAATPETIAERAGVGASWYHWVEEGRNIGLSVTALGWIADALDLVPAVRARVLDLAGLARHESAIGLTMVRAEPVPASLRRLLDGFALYPAYITGRRLDVLAWNEACEALFRCSTIAPERRNSFVFLFTQPDVRELIDNWDEQARSAVDELRAALVESPDDPWLLEVPALLASRSAEFQDLWTRSQRQQVRPGANTKILNKGTLGKLVFEAENLVTREAPDLCVRIYVPDAATQGRAEALLLRHRRDAAAKKKAGQYAVVRTVKEHLDACYAREVPLDELAALVGMNKFAMVRAFTLEVGFPPHAYQVLLRIHHARRLLLAGESAGATATAVGFADQSHLTRHFKRIEGITPGEYGRSTRRRLGDVSARR